MTRYLESQRALSGGGAEAVTTAVAAATGWRDIDEPPSGADSSGGAAWTRSPDGLWSATLPNVVQADPLAGAWRSWPLLTPDGLPVVSEWSGAVQVIPVTPSQELEVMYGYADGPLDTATRAVLWSVTRTSDGAMQAGVWTLEDGTWSNNYGSASAASYGAYGVRGDLAWADANNFIKGESNRHRARLLEADGRALNYDIFNGELTPRLDWGAGWAAGARLHRVIAARIRGTRAGVRETGVYIRETMQALEPRSGRADPEPAEMLILLGQSNAKGKHNEGSTPAALPGLAAPTRSTHWVAGERFDDSFHDGPSNRAAGLLTADRGVSARVVVQSAADSKTATQMINQYMPEAYTASIRAGWPRVPVRAVIYDQGESDSTTTTAADAWQAKVETLIATSRAQWGDDVAWVLTKKHSTLEGLPGQDTINAAMDSIAAADPLVFVRETTVSDLGGDEIHYTAAAMKAFGDLDVADLGAAGLLDVGS